MRFVERRQEAPGRLVTLPAPQFVSFIYQYLLSTRVNLTTLDTALYTQHHPHASRSQLLVGFSLADNPQRHLWGLLQLPVGKQNAYTYMYTY